MGPLREEPGGCMAGARQGVMAGCQCPAGQCYELRKVQEGGAAPAVLRADWAVCVVWECGQA